MITQFISLFWLQNNGYKIIFLVHSNCCNIALVETQTKLKGFKLVMWPET